MPTPQWKIDEARKRRERTCPVCGVHFLANRPSAKGFCSRDCQIKNFSMVTKGRKHSAETKAKMSASGRAWRITNPEWEVRRREAASAACQTDEYREAALQRYISMLNNGTGICSDSVRDFTAKRAKWVLKKAREVLENETEFCELWRVTLERLRQENPYDGGDYTEYARAIGKALTQDKTIRDYQDNFFRKAIPLFSDEFSRVMESTPPTPPA